MSEQEKIAESTRILIVWCHASNDQDTDPRIYHAEKLAEELATITRHVLLRNGDGVQSLKSELWDRGWSNTGFVVVTFGGSQDQLTGRMASSFPGAKVVPARDFDSLFAL